MGLVGCLALGCALGAEAYREERPRSDSAASFAALSSTRSQARAWLLASAPILASVTLWVVGVSRFRGVRSEPRGPDAGLTAAWTTVLFIGLVGAAMVVLTPHLHSMGIRIRSVEELLIGATALGLFALGPLIVTVWLLQSIGGSFRWNSTREGRVGRFVGIGWIGLWLVLQALACPI